METCNDKQKTLIVNHVAVDLIHISMNIHGTRAVQKMIENITHTRQVNLM